MRSSQKISRKKQVISVEQKKPEDQRRESRLELESTLDRILEISGKENQCIPISTVQKIEGIPTQFFKKIDTEDKLYSLLRKRIIELYLIELPLHLINPCISQICRSKRTLKNNINNYFPGGQLELDRECRLYLQKIIQALTLKTGEAPGPSEVNRILIFRGLPLITGLVPIIENPNVFIRTIANRTIQASKEDIANAKIANERNLEIDSIIKSIDGYYSELGGKIPENLFTSYTLTHHLRINSSINFEQYYYHIRVIFGDWSKAISEAYKQYSSRFTN